MNKFNGLQKIAESILWKLSAVSGVLHAAAEMALHRATLKTIKRHFRRCMLVHVLVLLTI
jgi:uncharacterized membrane protein YsdA (DUF1294 family)